MGKRKKLPSTLDGAAQALDGAAQDATVRAVAASAALAAGGAAVAGRVVRDRLAKRAQQREERQYWLEAGETLAQGVSRVARGQLELAIALIEGRSGDDLGDAIHEARKALKRLRALLRLIRDLIGDDVYRRENKLVRDVGRRLSGARDAQVLIETLDGLTAPVSDELPPGTLARFRGVLVAEADQARDAQEDARERSELVATLSELRIRVTAWGLPDNGSPRSLGGGLQRTYRRGRRALHAAERQPTDEHLHELRKRAKDLWHATQLLGPAAGKRMAKVKRRAHRLSDLLGDDHDLAVLHDRASAGADLLEAAEQELLTALIEQRRTMLQRQALASGSRLYRRKPGKVRRRLSLSR